MLYKKFKKFRLADGGDVLLLREFVPVEFPLRTEDEKTLKKFQNIQRQDDKIVGTFKIEDVLKLAYDIDIECKFNAI
jgi:hypothetical protein